MAGRLVNLLVVEVLGFCVLFWVLFVFLFFFLSFPLFLAFTEILVVHVLPHWELCWVLSGWVGVITGLLEKACPGGMGPSLPLPATVACPLSSPHPHHVQPFPGEGKPIVSAADGRGGWVVLLSSCILCGCLQAGQSSLWHIAVTLDRDWVILPSTGFCWGWSHLRRESLWKVKRKQSCAAQFTLWKG